MPNRDLERFNIDKDMPSFDWLLQNEKLLKQQYTKKNLKFKMIDDQHSPQQDLLL